MRSVPLCPMSCALLMAIGRKMKMPAGIVRTNDANWQNCSSSFMEASISVSIDIAVKVVAAIALMIIVQSTPKIKLVGSM